MLQKNDKTGRTGPPIVAEAAFDLSRNIVYSFSRFGNRIAVIDAAYGVMSAVAELPFVITSLSLDATGTIYLTSTDCYLEIIDPVTFKVLSEYEILDSASCQPEAYVFSALTADKSVVVLFNNDDIVVVG